MSMPEIMDVEIDSEVMTAFQNLHQIAEDLKKAKEDAANLCNFAERLDELKEYNIFEKASAIWHFLKAALDITDEVLEEINSEYDIEPIAT